MHALSIAMGPVVWRLLFKDADKAKEAESKISFVDGVEVPLEDDYGQRVRVCGGAVSGVMLEDLDKSKQGAVEFGLHQARTQSLYTKMAEADQGLRAARSMQGPAMLSQMGGRMS